MVTVSEAIAEGTRGIRTLEPVIVDALLTEYDVAWNAVERTLHRYEWRIQAAIDAGVEPRPSWLRQQTWWRQMEASIETEMLRFDNGAARVLAHGQREAVGISAQSATLLTEAVNVGGGIVPRVNAGAMERWVSAMRPGSPVRRVIDGYGDRITESLTLRMSEGLGSGKGVTGILRDVRADVGPDAVRGRVHTFVRTETMRAYRGNSKDIYESMPKGMISGYRWQASLSGRTCIICISLHGTISKTYRTDQHVSCRCIEVPIVSEAYAPPRQFGETGPEWFARQDDAMQRRMLGTQGRYDLYKGGVPIDSMVGVKRSRLWGDSVYVKPAGAVTTVPVSSPVARRSAIKGAPDIKTAQDAESYMKRYTDVVQIGSQTPTSLQSIADGLESSAAPYGVRFSSIDLTTSARKGRKMANGNYSRNMRATDDAPGRLELNPSYTKSPAAANRSVRKAEDAFRASRDAEIAKYERYVADPARAQILDQNQRKLDTLRQYDKWSMSHVTDDPIRTTVIHEVGHAVYYQKNLGPVWESKVASLPPGVRPRVSQYGATNNSELFAETFAGYVEGVPMPPEMVRVMEEVLDGAK